MFKIYKVDTHYAGSRKWEHTCNSCTYLGSKTIKDKYYDFYVHKNAYGYPSEYIVKYSNKENYYAFPSSALYVCTDPKEVLDILRAEQEIESSVFKSRKGFRFAITESNGKITAIIAPLVDTYMTQLIYAGVASVPSDVVKNITSRLALNSKIEIMWIVDYIDTYVEGKLKDAATLYNEE